MTVSLWTRSHLSAICKYMREDEAGTLLAFGQRLRSVRLDSGFSQERLAELACLDRTYISLLERGKRNPSLLCVFSLAEALGVTLSDMCKF